MTDILELAGSRLPGVSTHLFLLWPQFIFCVGASVRKTGEILFWSLSSVLKTGYELGLTSAQEWENHC